MQKINQQDECFLEISRHMMNTSQNASKLNFKKEFDKFWEKIKQGESSKSNYINLIRYINNGINIQQNNRLSTQQQIITILLCFFEVEQPQINESYTLCEKVVEYIKFMIKAQFQDEYIQKQFINLINVILWKKRIFQIQCIEINEIEIVDQNFSLNNFINVFSNKSLQQIMKTYLLQINELPDYLIKLSYPEILQIVFDLASLSFNLSQNILNSNLNLDCGFKQYMYLPVQQQIQFILNLQEWNNQHLDLVTQFIFQNNIINLSQEIPKIIDIIIISKSIDYDRSILLLQKISQNNKYRLNYENLKNILIQTKQKQLANFIIDVIKEFEINQDQIVKQEIQKQSNHFNIIYLIIQLIKIDTIEELYNNLINQSIYPYQYIILHISIIIYNYNPNLELLQEQCLKFQPNEMELVLLFSLYSLKNLYPKRNAKLLQQFQNLIDNEEYKSFYDILAIIGLETSQEPVTNQKIGQILNKEWNYISSFLQQIKHPKQSQIIQGFSQILIFFKDENNESEFSHLYQIIRNTMKQSNKSLNYNNLIQYIQAFQIGKIEQEIQLYVQLLKINYRLENKHLRKKNNGEEISERSSEVSAENCEEKEQHFYKELQQQGGKLIDKLLKQLKYLEMIQLGRQENYWLAIQINRLLQISELKININHSLLNNEHCQILINEIQFQQSNIIWDSLFNNKMIQFATTIIHLFKNEKNAIILKLLIVELSKICKYKYYALLLKQYDILYLEQNINYQLNNFTKLQMLVHKYQLIIQIQDDFEFLKQCYFQQVQKSTFEQLGLLIAISLHCGINYRLIEGLGESNDICINKLIVGFSNAGLLQLVFNLVKPPKQQKKKKQIMEIEKKIEDYLQNQTLIQEIVNIVASNILKNLNKNQDLKHEFINLANKVYQYGQGSEYQLIFELFEDIPEELIINCLKSITIDDKFLDQKLSHIITLLNQFDKKKLNNEFYELSYNVIINQQNISQIMIEYCLQIINLIKMNETIEFSQLQNPIDMLQLKEQLIPEPFEPTGCTQQNTKQEIFLCIQCQYNNRQNIRCCSSCAFDCHINHNIQYECTSETICECNKTKKCNQKRKPQLSNKQLKEQLFMPSSAQMRLDDTLGEREYRAFRQQQQRFDQILDFSSHFRTNLQGLEESDIELEDSQQSSQNQLQQEESNVEIIERFDSSSASIIEIEANQFEAKETKGQPKILQNSQFFQKLKIDFEKLFDKMIEMCNFTFNRYKLNFKESYDETEQFSIDITQAQSIQRINTVLQQENTIQHESEPIDVSKSVNAYRRTQQNGNNHYSPFQIRQIISEGEAVVVLSSKTSLRFILRNTYFETIEKKSNVLQQRIIKTNFQIDQPILSLSFNQQNRKQLIVSSFNSIYLLELKSDGTIQNDQKIISQPFIISKIFWVNNNQICWLVYQSVVIFNLKQKTQQTYSLSSDEKIKDFCIIRNFILCVNFSGDIYCQRIMSQSTQQKFNMIEKIELSDQLKGKDKTPYCLSKIENTEILLISYKNGASFICNFDDKKFINIIRLDEYLVSLKIDDLLASPQLISQTKKYIRFTVLADQSKSIDKSNNLHCGNLLFIEINNKGNILVQQLYHRQIEGYCLIKNIENNTLNILAISNDEKLITLRLGLKDNNIKNKNEKKQDNLDQLTKNLKEKFDINLLKQAFIHFLPLQNFCLQPSLLATPQQLLIGPTSITFTQGFAITGLIINRPNVDQIEIFSYRTIQKKNNQIIIPLNYVEQIYTYLNHSITFSQHTNENIQVYIKKFSLSQDLISTLLSTLNQDVNSIKGYSISNLNERNQKLKLLSTEQELNLINSLDALGMTLQAYQNQKINFPLITQLIELIQQKNQKNIIIESAKKLLKIMLKNHKALLGSEFDYKSIKDRILLENLKNQTAQNGILKLFKIANNRLPQLFYIFNQIPQSILEILNESCNYKAYCQILLRYLQFLQNCQKDVDDCLSQIEEIKQTWKIANKNIFNRTFIEELINFQKNLKTEVFDYAWDFFVQEQNKDKIEIESNEDKSCFFLDFNIEEFVSDNIDDYDLIENQIAQNKLKQQQKAAIQTSFPKPKPSQKLTVQSYDLITAYSKWLQKNIMQKGNSIKSNKKDIQYFIQSSFQFYTLTKLTQNSEIQNDYYKLIEFKNKEISSLILLTFINGKNLKDKFWLTSQKYKLFLNLDNLYQYLQQIQQNDQKQSVNKLKHFRLEQFRQILKNFEQKDQIFQILMEQKNQLICLQIIKYLLNASKINAQVTEQLQSDKWTSLICQLKYNQNYKQICKIDFKQLFQQIIAKQNYHQAKDKILYQYLIKELNKPQKSYFNRQQIYIALNRILKNCRKRPENWTSFCDSSVMEIIKSLIKQFPKETLEIIEFII